MTSFQSSELTELPLVENSQLFAQRAHSARYAPFVPKKHQKTPNSYKKTNPRVFSIKKTHRVTKVTRKPPKSSNKKPWGAVGTIWGGGGW